jgi:hypothetical protein
MGTYIITMACNGHVPFRNAHVAQVRSGTSKGNPPLWGLSGRNSEFLMQFQDAG